MNFTHFELLLRGTPCAKYIKLPNYHYFKSTSVWLRRMKIITKSSSFTMKCAPAIISKSNSLFRCVA